MFKPPQAKFNKQLGGQANNQTASQANNHNNWTTADELETVDTLFQKRSLQALRNYINTARTRSWHGPGMMVNPQLVILYTEQKIHELEKQDQVMKAKKTLGLL